MFEKELHHVEFGKVFLKNDNSNNNKKDTNEYANDCKDSLKRSRNVDDDSQQDKKKHKKVTSLDVDDDQDVDDDEDDDDCDTLRASLLDENLNITLLTHSQCTDAHSPFLDIRPSYIILMDPDVTIIRMIETYQVDPQQHVVVKVYFLMYKESIEEYRYAMSLSHEKKSFEELIRKKSHMVITIPDPNQDYNSRTQDVVARSSSGRQHNDNSTSRVVVDIREFGSSLPSLLHLNHIKIYPVTLLVS